MTESHTSVAFQEVLDHSTSELLFVLTDLPLVLWGHGVLNVVGPSTILKPILGYALGLRFGNLKRSKMREKTQLTRVNT